MRTPPRRLPPIVPEAVCAREYPISEIDAAIAGAQVGGVEKGVSFAGVYSEKSATSRLEKNKAIGVRNRDKLGTVTLRVSDTFTYEILNERAVLRGFKKRAMGLSRSHVIPVIRSRGLPKPKAIAKVGKRPTLPSDMKKAVAHATSNDETRAGLMTPHLNGDTGELVASDGYHLVVVLGVKGNTTLGRYPAYERVIPGYVKGKMPDTTGSESASIDTGAMLSKLNQALAAMEGGTSVYVQVIQMPDGTIEIGYRNADGEEYQSADLSKGKRVVSLDAQYFHDAMTFLRRMGNEFVMFCWTTDLSSVLIAGVEEYSVNMPMRV